MSITKIAEQSPVSQEKGSSAQSRSIRSRVARVAKASLSEIEQKEKEYQKNYRQINGPKIAARKRQYYLDNRDEKIAYQKQYRKAKKARSENPQPASNQVPENGIDLLIWAFQAVEEREKRRWPF